MNVSAVSVAVADVTPKLAALPMACVIVLLSPLVLMMPPLTYRLTVPMPVPRKLVEPVAPNLSVPPLKFSTPLVCVPAVQAAE